MRWQEYLKSFDPRMTIEDIDHILWTWTPYPMGGAKQILKHFSTYVRAVKKDREICWFCSVNKKFKHKKWCPVKLGLPDDCMP